VAASLRRITFAASPTRLDFEVLAAAARKKGPELVLEVLEAEPEGSTERGFAEAARATGQLRVALFNEHLREFDFAAGRWGRVPRVAASIASTTAFLLAALSLRMGLDGAYDLEEDARAVALNGAIMGAVDIVALGLAAATACAFAHRRAQKLGQEATKAADALAERLESYSALPKTSAVSFE
jgi:hypothetical protein